MSHTAARDESDMIAVRRRATAKIDLLVECEVDWVEQPYVFKHFSLDRETSAFDPLYGNPVARRIRPLQLIKKFPHRSHRPLVKSIAVVFQLNRSQYPYFVLGRSDRC